MKKVTVSVLITTYNLEKYIAGALESVLRQKGDFNMEILVGDDGSSDDTVSVINKYISQYPQLIKLYQMPREEGVSYNRVERSSSNRINLLENASGDYICFLDGDDFYIDDRKFEKQLAVLESDTSISMCTHNVVIYGGEDTPYEGIEGTTLVRAKKPHRWSFEKYWSLEFIQANAMLYRNVYNKGNGKCAKSLKEIFELNPALKNNFDDNNITLAFFAYGDMYYIPDIMGAYRQIEGSSWNGIDELKKHCSNMIGYSIEKSLLTDVKDVNASLSRHYVNFKYLIDNYEKLSEDNCQPFYDTAVKYSIMPALGIYQKSDKDYLLRECKKAKALYQKAKLGRITKKILGIY